MGSDNRMNFTAFGDSVNVAARLEGVNKLFGTRIIISKDVYKTLPKVYSLRSPCYIYLYIYIYIILICLLAGEIHGEKTWED